jgi:hypothetical protein
MIGLLSFLNVVVIHCYIIRTRLHPPVSHAVFQMEEEARQRAQDALELARRHEEDDAMRRAGILHQPFRSRSLVTSLQHHRRRFQKRKSRLRVTSSQK